MSENILGSFINKKKAESAFLTLEDGESAKVKLVSWKLVTKAGYDGKEKEVLRLVLDVDTTEGIKEKTFDNGTQKFAQELANKGIEPGKSFVITRQGLQTKTKYEISDVK